VRAGAAIGVPWGQAQSSSLPSVPAARRPEGAAHHGIQPDDGGSCGSAPSLSDRDNPVSAAAERWVRAQQLIAEQPCAPDGAGNVADRLRRICGAAATALSASGAGVSVMTGEGSWGFAVASDPAIQPLEELRFTPSCRSMAGRRYVRSPHCLLDPLQSLRGLFLLQRLALLLSVGFPRRLVGHDDPLSGG
jgi:hypothetical protein